MEKPSKDHSSLEYQGYQRTVRETTAYLAVLVEASVNQTPKSDSNTDNAAGIELE